MGISFLTVDKITSIYLEVFPFKSSIYIPSFILVDFMRNYVNL